MVLPIASEIEEIKGSKSRKNECPKVFGNNSVINLKAVEKETLGDSGAALFPNYILWKSEIWIGFHYTAQNASVTWFMQHLNKADIKRTLYHVL